MVKEETNMKKVIAFALMLALVLSCGAMAFADSSNGSPVPTPPPSGGGGGGAGAGGPATLAQPNFVLDVYDGEDKMVEEIGKDRIVYAQVGQANLLPAADKEAFLKAYEAVKEIKDKVVKYFFWLNVKDYKIPAGDYLRYDFTCKGENVQCQVNGKDMEVVNVDGDDYYAKLTELGAVAILCD